MTDAAIRPAGTGPADHGPAGHGPAGHGPADHGPAGHGSADLGSAPHPLDPVTAAEFRAGREILAGAGLLTGQVRFAYYGLEEPPKAQVLAFAAGTNPGPGGGATTSAAAPANGAGGAPPDRRLRAFLVNVVTGESTDAILSLG